MIASIDTLDTLVFDLDDTLVIEEASAKAAFIQAGQLATTKYGLDAEELHTTVRKSCRELWHRSPAHPFCRRIGISSWEGMWSEFTGADPELEPLRRWAPQYRVESWRIALRSHGIDDLELARALAEAFPRLRRVIHALYPDTIKVLEYVFPRYSLGLLTNGAADLQRRKLEGSGLARYFQQVLISGETGVAKPDRRAFEMLLVLLGSSAERALMIGDSLERDVHGAQEAGMRAVWVNRSGKAHDDRTRPDWEIPTLTDLLPILS